MRARLTVIEAFEAFEIIEGQVSWFPFFFKGDDGRHFALWPRHGVFDLINWFKKGEITVEIIRGIEQTKGGKGWLGDLKRL